MKLEDLEVGKTYRFHYFASIGKDTRQRGDIVGVFEGTGFLQSVGEHEGGNGYFFDVRSFVIRGKEKAPPGGFPAHFNTEQVLEPSEVQS